MGEIDLDEGTYRRTQRRREDLFRSCSDVDELGGRMMVSVSPQERGT
jgi:hypothetical protein